MRKDLIKCMNLQFQQDMESFNIALRTKCHNNNEKFLKMFDAKIQEFFINIEEYKKNNIYEDEKYKLYLYLLFIIEPIAYKLSNYAPRFVTNKDLIQESFFIFENFLKITGSLKQNYKFFKIMIKSKLRTIIRKNFGIKKHDVIGKNKQYYQKYKKLENLEFENLINNDYQIKKMNLFHRYEENKILKNIQLANLSDNELLVIKLSYFINNDFKFEYYFSKLSQQEITNIINKKFKTNFNIGNIKKFKFNAIRKLRKIYKEQDSSLYEYNKDNQLIKKIEFYSDKKTIFQIFYYNPKKNIVIKKIVYLQDGLTINFQQLFDLNNGTLIETIKYKSDGINIERLTKHKYNS